MPTPTDRPAALATTPWPLLADALLAGLNHSLSNRSTALRALSARTLEPERVVEVAGTEASKLEGLVHLYRHLESTVGEAAEPLLAADVVADAVALLGIHPLLREVRVRTHPGSTGLALLAPRRSLIQALTIILADAGRRVDLGSDEPGLTVSCQEAEGIGIISITTDDAALPEPDDPGCVAAVLALMGETRVSLTQEIAPGGRFRASLVQDTLARRRSGGR